MASERTQRRLAAIVAADVAGYSRLMGKDEEGTLAALTTHRRELIEPFIAEHRGRIVKTTGDGLLAEFASVVDAVQYAVAFQEGMRERNKDTPEDRRIEFRIGVNVGDIIVEDDDIFGDGVNVAARLEGLAAPGGVLLSEDAWRQLKGERRTAFEDAGEQRLKNITDPVRTYNWIKDLVAPLAAVGHTSANRPTVAVLPFNNMSGDAEQEYFADGITEDITTALSKHRWLRVVARNSAFGYKGQSPDVRQVAAELGADYVVEGSVRRSGGRVRITAQLIDATTGDHLWAERYDRDLEDIFAVQDEITDTIVARIEPELGAAERHRVAQKPRTNLRAWDCYHLGTSHFFKFTGEGNLEAQRLFKHSTELDPSFGEAYAWWAYAVILGMIYWDIEPEEALLDEALTATKRALEIDDQNAVFYALKARIHLARCEYPAALSSNEAAIRLNPTFAVAYCALGDSLAYEGRYDEAIGQFEKAISLSPNDPQRWAFLTYGALAMIFKRDFETALEWAERASVVPNCQYWTTAHMAVALAYLDRHAEAKGAIAKLLAEKPGFTCEFAKRKLFYIKRSEQLALYLDGLSKAGLPE
jgi:TolB-like protein